MKTVLGSRGSIGGVLGQGRGAAAAAQWWLAGGVSAANAIAVYQPIGAASLAASYDNNAAPGNGLADGTYDAAPGVAPAFTSATGWTFDSATKYLTTGVLPTTAWSVIVRFSDVTTTGFLFGAFTILAGIAIAPRRGAATTVRYWNNGPSDRTPALSSGVLAIAGTNCYRNGVADGTTPGGGSFSHTIYIGGANDSGPLYGPLTNGKIQAFAIYNTTLSAAQVAAISSAMAALTG